MALLADPVELFRPAARVAVSLGFMPLTDCAPLIVAQQEGYFTAEGLDVSLSREASWANIRDKVLVGALDGAQMIAPMPLAMSLGIGTPVTPMATLLTLSVQGNTITLAQSLLDTLGPEAAFERPLSAARLKAVLPDLTARRGRPLTFAAVFGISTHMLQLRDWLAAGGIDPDAELRVIVVPPAQTVAQIEAGNLDGFCAGEPWGSWAAARGVGQPVALSSDITPGMPEKVFAVRADFAARAPVTVSALIRALVKAGAWCDAPANRSELARRLASPELLALPEAVIAASLTAEPPFTSRFHQFSGPWQRPDLGAGQALLTSLKRWRLVPPETEPAAVARCQRADLFDFAFSAA